MKYALLIIESNPNDKIEKSAKDLMTFAEKSYNILADDESISMLNPGAILLNLESGLTRLSHLISLAEAEELQFRTLFYEKTIYKVP